GRRIYRTRQVHGLVGNDADSAATDAREGGHYRLAEIAAQFQHRADVADMLDRLAHIVSPAAVLRDNSTQYRGVRLDHLAAPRSEIGKVTLGEFDSIRFVLGYEVDHARLGMHVDGPYLLRRQPLAHRRSYQRRPAKTNGAPFYADQTIAHAGKVGMTGKGPRRHDADSRHEARKPGEDHERLRR